MQDPLNFRRPQYSGAACMGNRDFLFPRPPHLHDHPYNDSNDNG